MDSGSGETAGSAIAKKLWSARIRESSVNDQSAKQERTQTQLRKSQVASNYLRQSPRRWNHGELYSPHDLSPEELARFRKPTRPKFDVIDVLGINPLDEYQVSQGGQWRSGKRDPPELSRLANGVDVCRKKKADIVPCLLLAQQNFSMISEYMTPMGRIKHPKETCLRPVNQRKIAKAIRRAVGLGLHPSVHHHPEILKSRYASVSSSNRRNV